MRVGQGFDVHRLVPGRRLVLAGIEVPHERGLDGHSDADVLAHAVADALLGALGAGDLGAHFPSDDPRWENASGRDLLRPILTRIAERGLKIVNIDSTVIAQEPRLAPFRAEFQKALADMLEVGETQVNVKLKSTDRLGAVGRGEGIAAEAIALLAESRK